MRYRELKKSGIRVSAFGLGCMRFPMTTVDGENVVDESISTPIIRHLIDSGVNYVDTAYVYSEQKNETAVGHALRDGYRDRVYLATKLPSWACNTPDDMEKVLDIQLERLETDHIDFYLVHALNRESWDKMSSFGVCDFLDRMKACGKIKYAAFSFHDSYEVFEEILRAYDWDMCQLQFNFMDINRQAGLKGVRLAGELGVPVVVMEGLLGGKLAKAPQNVQALYDEFPIKRSAVEWAFRWLANHPEVATILSGVTDMEQAVDNLAIFDRCETGIMSAEEEALIQRVRDAYNARTMVGCTGCRYCVPCPNEVDIPGIFAIWNDRSLYDRPMKGDGAYKSRLEKGNGADRCVACGLCKSACPQHIDIIEKLKQADLALR